jgi:hypothetical protein
MYDDWVDQYQPIQNPFDKNAGYEGCMFETYGEENEFVLDKLNRNTVWTLITGDNEESWIIPGYHIVNRMGFFITTKPWESTDIEVNNNEMCTVGAAKYACIEFIENKLNIPIEQFEDEIHDYFANKF